MPVIATSDANSSIEFRETKVASVYDSGSTIATYVLWLHTWLLTRIKWIAATKTLQRYVKEWSSNTERMRSLPMCPTLGATAATKVSPSLKIMVSSETGQAKHRFFTASKFQKAYYVVW